MRKNWNKSRTERPLIPSFSNINNDPEQNIQYFRNLSNQRQNNIVENSLAGRLIEQHDNNTNYSEGHPSNFFSTEDMNARYDNTLNERYITHSDHKPSLAIRIPNYAASNIAREISSLRKMASPKQEKINFMIKVHDNIITRYEDVTDSSSDEGILIQSRSVSTTNKINQPKVDQISTDPRLINRTGRTDQQSVGQVVSHNYRSSIVTAELNRRVTSSPDNRNIQHHSRFSPVLRELPQDILGTDDVDEDMSSLRHGDTNSGKLNIISTERRSPTQPLLYYNTHDTQRNSMVILRDHKEMSSHNRAFNSIDRSDMKRYRCRDASDDTSTADDEHEKTKRIKRSRNKDSKKKKKKKKSKKSKKKRSKSHKMSRHISSSDASDAIKEPENSPVSHTKETTTFGSDLILGLLREAIKKQGVGGVELEKNLQFNSPSKPDMSTEHSHLKNVKVVQDGVIPLNSRKNQIYHPLTHSSPMRGNFQYDPHQHYEENKLSDSNPAHDNNDGMSSQQISSDHSVNTPPPRILQSVYLASKYMSPQLHSINTSTYPGQVNAHLGRVSNHLSPQSITSLYSNDVPIDMKCGNSEKVRHVETPNTQKVPSKDQNSKTSSFLKSCDPCKELNLTPQQYQDHLSLDHHMMVTGIWWDLHPNPNPLPQYCLIWCVLCKSCLMVGVDIKTVEEHEMCATHKRREGKWVSDFSRLPRFTWCPLISLKTTTVNLTPSKKVKSLGGGEKKNVGELYKEVSSVLRRRGLLLNLR